MKNKCIKIWLTAVLAMFCQVPNASAVVPVTIPTVTLTNYAGDTSTVVLEILGEGSKSVTINVSLGSGTVADIRGVFFSWQGNLTNVSVTGDNVTGSAFSNDGSVYNLGNGVTMHGDGNDHSFDGGVMIGEAGLGKKGSDDIHWTSFTLKADQNIYFDNFGARLQTLQVGGNRNGSSKLFAVNNSDGGGVISESTPEPGSILLIGVSVALARYVRLRKNLQEV
jgi:hypothetical protein